MKISRFSISGLMGFVLIVGVGFAALAQATILWASVCFSVMLAALLLSLLTAIQARGKVRTFCMGFATAGIASLVAFDHFGSNRFEAPPLIIEPGMDALEALFHPSTSNSLTSVGFFSVTTSSSPTLVASTPGFAYSMMPSFVPTPVSPAPSASPAPPVTPAPPAGSPVPTSNPNISITGTLSGTPMTMAPVWTGTEAFHQVCYSQSVLIIAYLGGLYSLMLAGRRDRQRAGTPPDGPIAA